MSVFEITIEFHAANLLEPIEAIVLYSNKEEREGEIKDEKGLGLIYRVLACETY